MLILFKQDHPAEMRVFVEERGPSSLNAMDHLFSIRFYDGRVMDRHP